MPAPRFWEFEDAQVDIGSVDAGPTDLARMLPVEFTIDYGNDWFVIPVELEVGSLCRTRSLVINVSFENDIAGSGGQILETSRHLRDVLRAKGYEVHYREFAGGHDYLSWRGSLADGLIALMGTRYSQRDF